MGEPFIDDYISTSEQVCSCDNGFVVCVLVSYAVLSLFLHSLVHCDSQVFAGVNNIVGEILTSEKQYKLLRLSVK